MFNLGPGEILVILLIALLIFGPKKLPEIGKSIGQGMREFKRASQSIVEEIERAGETKPAAALPEQKEESE